MHKIVKLEKEVGGCGFIEEKTHQRLCYGE